MSEEKRWRLLVAAIVVFGLAIRIASVLVRPHLAPAGDPVQYLGQANLFAQGKGFIEPLIYHATHVEAQTAKLPPLYTLLLSLCSVAGFKSFFAHRIWSAFLNTPAIWLAALIGRDIASRKVGLLAALLVAVYPNLWLPAGLGMSETVSPGLVLFILWAGYRMWRRPDWKRAATLGLAIGLGALARDELILMAALVLLPIAIGGRGRPWRDRLRLLGAGGAAIVLVVGPWVGYNLDRFSHPVFITDRFGLALATANCDTAWHGPFPGFWSMQCAEESVVNVTGDESAQQGPSLHHALKYIGDHIGGLPAQEMFRLGRTFGVYQPGQQVDLDSDIEARPRPWVITGLGMYYAMLPLVPWGVWMLRRRGVPLFPLAAAAVDVVIVVLLTYGNTRFRATLDPVIVLLASVALVDLFRRVAGRRPPGPGEYPTRSGPTSAGPPESGRRAEVDA